MAARPNRGTLATVATLVLVVALLAPSPVVVGGAQATPDGPSPTPASDGLPADADGPADRPAPEAAGAPDDGETHRLELVTGETVAVYERGGERSYEVVSGGPVSVVTLNERTYLLPEGVDLGTYDRSLFAVEALLSAESGSGDLPVLLHTDASTAEVEAAGLHDVRRLESAGVVAAEFDPARAGGTIAGLVADGVVHGVSLDRRVEGPPAVDPAAPASGPPGPGNRTGEGVTVAVLDTGVDATHPALADAVVDQVDLVDGNATGEDEGAGDASGAGAAVNGSEVAPDENGHGTYVAGVLGATAGDDGDHAGVAPGVDIVDVRVMNDRGGGRASTIIQGIEYAVERDVDVILLSVGTSIDGGDEIAASVEWAAEQGVVVVAAAGNDGNPRTIGAPGRPGGAITVGATDGDGRVAAYSSRGPTLDGGLKPDLVAPGDRIVGPRSSNSGRTAIDGDGRYTWVSGTSAAAPQVAGAAALLLQSEPDLTAREVEARLASAARPVDGVGAYAEGGGELDVAGALDPDVVVTDSVVDFGLVTENRTVNRTITVANHDDRRHELTFDVGVRNVDLGVDANGTARLDRTSLSLAPGERANLTLSVDGDTASGAHAGTIRYSVAGEPRSVAFGFVRGGTVTVEKRPLSAGGRVDGDALWVLTERGNHDELLEFENGTASFVAGGGTYVLWSWGTDEPTDTSVFLSERRGFDGPTRVVLDEGETVPVGVDAGPIVERYGQLRNLSVTASMSTPYAHGVAKLSVSDLDTENRTVRVSPDPNVDAATTYLLAAGPGGPAALDVADVFQLGHGVQGVSGPSVVQVDVSSLETTEQRLHRTTVDQTYRVQDRLRLHGVWNQIDHRWFDLGGRTTQRVHRFPTRGTYYRTFRGEGWTAHRAASGAAEVDANVLAHPMHGLVAGPWIRDGNLAVAGTPFSDGAGTRFAPPGSHRMTVSIDGEVVREERVRDGRRSFDGVRVEPGENLTVRLVGDNPGAYLSTRTVTEVSVPDYRPADGRLPVDVNRPPVVTNVAVLGADDANAVPPGEVTAAYEVDAVGPAINPVVWYSVESPAEPPWRNRSGWTRADTERFDGRLLATFDVDESAETVSLAAQFGDIRGHRTRTMTVDAVHVGAAPDTTTSMLRGRLRAPNGSAADNDTVVVDPVGDRRPRFVRTDGNGSFAVELPRGRSYDLTYVRGGPWVAGEPTPDRRPAWRPLSRVRIDDDVDLGVRTLPTAGDLVVSVTDERGEPVPGASVRLTGRAGNVSANEVMETGADGLARRSGVEAPGIRLAGSVAVTVDPPDDALYPGDGHRFDVTLDDRRVLNATLETAPPEAALAAFGTFEPGSVVFLHAYESHVPAGTVEYRWDVDGDGEVDRVTDEPVVRHTFEAGTHRPTLSVVDRAGKTDRSTLSLRIGGNESGTSPRLDGPTPRSSGRTG